MIAIIKSCGSNFASIQYALDCLKVESVVTNNPDEIKSADKVILAGVGHAKSAMKKLKETNLIDLIKNLKQPVLGIYDTSHH